MDQKIPEGYLETLERLVNIDSGTGAPSGATRVGLMLAEPLVQRGWSLERHVLGPSVGECIVVKNREAPRYDALLVGHTDTVFPAGETAKRPFKMDRERAYGVGTLDMKQGCLAAVYALLELSDEALETLNIAVVFNPDEEILSPFSMPVLDAYAQRSDHAYIFEAASTDGARVDFRKGLLRAAYAFHGKSGHAGYAFENGGVSAVHEMARWIVELTALHDRDTGTSVNVGAVHSRAAANVIADYAEMEVDARYVTGTEMRRVEAALEELAAHAAQKGVRTEAIYRICWPPLEPDERTRAYWKRMRSVSERLGIPFRTKSRGGVSDANHIAAHGPITVDGLGPTGDFDHSPNEYLELSTIAPSIRFMRELLEDLAAEKREKSAGGA